MRATLEKILRSLLIVFGVIQLIIGLSVLLIDIKSVHIPTIDTWLIRSSYTTVWIVMILAVLLLIVKRYKSKS